MTEGYGKSSQILQNGQVGRTILAAETQAAVRSATGDMQDISGTGLIRKAGAVGTAPSIATAQQVRDAGDIQNYIASQEDHLVVNGSGLLNSNFNFSGATFDPVDTYSGGGSFAVTGQSGLQTDSLIPVTPELCYEMSCYMKAGNLDGSSFSPQASSYAGVACFDIDGLLILPQYFMQVSGAVNTTLASPLNPGDTTIQLVNAAGWSNGGTAFSRHIRWYGYTNQKGYTYPAYTYSRFCSYDFPGHNIAAGTWDAGGIAGNIITLRVPWLGPSLPAGTAVSNASSGGSYKYIAASNVQIPNTWQRYSGKIRGFDTARINATDKFSYGTSFIRLLFLLNLLGAGNLTNRVRISMIRLSTLCPSNFSAGEFNSVQLFSQGLRLGSGAAILNNALSVTKVAEGNATETITVTGAQVGDHVLMSRGTGYVSASNTVTFDGTGLGGVTVRATILRVV